MSPTIAAIGTEAEVAHHVRRLQPFLDIRVMEPEVAATGLRRGDLAIFTTEHFERFRRCCMELRKRGVATLYMIDGILEWRNAWENRPDEPASPMTMRPVLAHKVACIGSSQFRTLTAWGNHEKVELVGIPRLDGLRSRWSGKKSGDQRTFRILVVTAKFPGFTPEQIRITRQSLAAVRDFAAASAEHGAREISLTWRIDPALAREIGVVTTQNSLDGIELQEQLSTHDAVMTTASTAMLESMLMGKPTALIDFHNCPQYVPAVWNIRSPADLPAVVSQLLDPPREKMNLQEQWLEDALQLAEPATERMVKLISRMLGVANQSDDVPVFPANLLDDTDGEKNLTPTCETADGASVVELAAEVAHCRREIVRLEGIISGLRNELGQAHEIFDQIQRHPIAGPVVRLRERMKRWMSRRAEKTVAVENGQTVSPVEEHR